MKLLKKREFLSFMSLYLEILKNPKSILNC